jgi:hypothetical protein
LFLKNKKVNGVNGFIGIMEMDLIGFSLKIGRVMMSNGSLASTCTIKFD